MSQSSAEALSPPTNTTVGDPLRYTSGTLAATADVDQPREVAGFRADRHGKRVNEQNNSDQQNV